ncbi:hypothetical protein PI124_g18704 [Phytophthora idaei]|nr:hypothetical protein PI124_g18704 [Phytophthora idaei]
MSGSTLAISTTAFDTGLIVLHPLRSHVRHRVVLVVSTVLGHLLAPGHQGQVRIGTRRWSRLCQVHKTGVSIRPICF